MIKKGTWVEIMQIVLTPEERSNAIPEDTKNTPLKLWAKGFCLSDCEIGGEVEIETITKRVLKGVATEEKPGFSHDFGEFVEEVLYIGPQAKELLWGDGNE